MIIFHAPLRSSIPYHGSDCYFSAVSFKPSSGGQDRKLGWAYTFLYIVQVGFQVSFQVDQDAVHVESDLESPGVSYGPEIFRSAKCFIITFYLYNLRTVVRIL